MPASRRIDVTGLTNQAFLEKHARPGRIGLAGGGRLLEKTIRRAQRHIVPSGGSSDWSHAFLFSGVRDDSHHWVLESDLDILHKNVRFGVQENRISKYFNAAEYPLLAVLDLGLTPGQTREVLAQGLELLSQRAPYSVRELAGTLLALRHPRLRGKENLLAREGALYCSAFVQHCVRSIGIDLAPGLSEKNTTPQHIAATPVPHTFYMLKRA